MKNEIIKAQMKVKDNSNPNFKLVAFREFKIDSATQSFTMSPSRKSSTSFCTIAIVLRKSKI